MPATVSRLRGALLLLFLVACRTRDNPEICNRVGECLTGFQCNLSTQQCVPTGGTDVGRSDGGADGPAADRTGSDGPAADGSQDAEGSCVTSANCAMADKPVCSTAGRCVGCMGHADCTTDPNKPVCLDSACVACNQAQAPATACEQKNLASPRCTSTGACAECVTSRDCSQPTAPICVDGKCARCTADSQCRERDGDNPGLCMAHLDGRCASDAEVIYVRSGVAACVPDLTGPGTAEMPFCQPEQALENVAPDRRILLLRGMEPFGPINVRAGFPGTAGGPISIIGQPGAAIAPGAFAGVTVGGGDIYLRDITIRDGEKEGVLADGPANVHLNKCVIRLNKKGGLRFQNGAGFEVANTILEGNGPGFLNDGLTPFGGAYLGTPEAGRPGVFRFNTVIRNGMVGVACGRPSMGQLLDSVLLFDNGADEYRNCQTKNSVAGPGRPPMFDPVRPYWLTAGSPCVDQGNPDSFPPDDWKGEPRPGGTRADCGADEFHPQ